MHTILYLELKPPTLYNEEYCVLIIIYVDDNTDDGDTSLTSKLIIKLTEYIDDDPVKSYLCHDLFLQETPSEI